MDKSRREVASAAASAGGTTAASLFRTDIAVDTKSGKTDVVTRADQEAQAAVSERIAETFPEETVVGEEGDAPTTIPQSGAAWIVDPIDGTHNYVNGNRRWTTSVATVVDGKPVAAANVLPALGDSYVAGRDGVRRNGEPVSVSDRTDPETFTVVPTIWWELDRREEYAAATEAIVTRFGDLARLGSAQATLSLLAGGGIDGAITNLETNPWDTVAGAYMVEQAGGTVTDLDGDPWTHESSGLVASNGRRHDLVLAAARAIEGARSQ